VVVYNHWMHIWITQTSKSKVRMMIKLISIEYLLKQIGFVTKPWSSHYGSLSLRNWWETLVVLLCKAHLVPYIHSNVH
jgi:hypothetical protein